jgi:hypothetical protein
MKGYEIMMKRILTIAAIVGAAAAMPASATVVDGINWADEMVDCTATVTNYGLYNPPGQEYLADNPQWLEGPPDCDVDGSGYFFDDPLVDNDYLAGWDGRGAKDSFITVRFDTAINDLDGNDLVIVSYGAPNGEEDVLVSSTGADGTWVKVGVLPLGGQPGYFTEEWFDFAGLVDDVHYVKITRPFSSPCPSSGRWIDAVGGTVPEPATLTLLGLGGLGLIRRKRKAL